jgi:cysteine sulfinate desulfinase/cysteine desulfurase-like protein
VYASAGSACQARKHDVPASYAAAGLSADDARHVLRFSFARTSTRADVERAVTALVAVGAELDGVGAR